MIDLALLIIGMGVLAVFLFLLSIPNKWEPISWKNEGYKNKKIIIKKKREKISFAIQFFLSS